MTPTEGPSKHRQQLERLFFFLLVVAILAALWAISVAYALAERGRIIERAQSQLTLTIATLADLNELAETATGTPSETRKAQRSAAIWRALLQYPTASIWVEADGAVTAGQRPIGNLADFILVREARPHFTLNAALPRADALAEWRRSGWQQGGILVGITIGFLLLTNFLTDALRQRATAEEALREHDGLLKAVTKSAAELLGSRNFGDLVAIVLELIGQTVAVSRVQISAIERDHDGHLRARLRYEWSSPGLSSLVGDRELGEIDLSAQMPKLIAPLLAGSLTSLFIDDLDGPYRETFERAGIRSFLQIPVQIDGQLWGSLNFIDSAASKRRWSWAETDTLATLAGLVGIALARGRYVKELADANMIVENSSTILYRLRSEPSLPLIYVSQNITKFGHDPADLLAEQNWLQRLFHPEDQAKVGAAMTRVMEGDGHAASIECRLAAGGDSYRWVDNRYKPVRDKDGRLVEIEGIIVDITDRKLAEDKVALLARTDSLTGLANRRTFGERLQQAFAATRRNGAKFAVLFLDLDHFKSINDTLGHPGGDLLLQQMAERLAATVRETDLVARLGGDEFAVLQTEMSEPVVAGILAAKIKETLSRPYVIYGTELHLTISIGISPFVPGTTDPEAMMSQADLALYRAKRDGRNRYCFYSKELDQQMPAGVAANG